MADENAAYVIYGLELQSAIHFAMPVRNMLYDAIQYANQVEKTAKVHKKNFVYDVFEFNVISIKRLYTNFENEMGNPIMLSRGWIIVKEFDEDLIAKEIESIVSKCRHLDDEDNYIELSSYFRRLNL